MRERERERESFSPHSQKSASPHSQKSFSIATLKHTETQAHMNWNRKVRSSSKAYMAQLLKWY